MAMDEVLEHLQEPEAPPGALECDYDYFKMLCFAERRSMERSGQATHLALISILGETKRMTERVLKNTVSQLAVQIHENLRRCDVYSQCSVSQFILMLPGANYENSCMICRRFIHWYPVPPCRSSIPHAAGSFFPAVSFLFPVGVLYFFYLRSCRRQP